MNMLIKTLAAVMAGTVLATSVLAESATSADCGRNRHHRP